MTRRKLLWVVAAVVGAGLMVALWTLSHKGSGRAAERGRALYALHCAACHSAEGRARGNATALENPDFLEMASDKFLRTTIARGRRGTKMPGFASNSGGPLSSGEIQDLVAFLRTWKREVTRHPTPRVGRGNSSRGGKLYEVACANCHGWEGRGGLGMGPALNNSDFLAAADDAFLWATIAYGRRGTPMFPSLRGLDGIRQLSAAEIDDLVAYLRSWEGSESNTH